mmetsp:Transcript_10704/g.29277  ORF Transcript_10704/g.29277 Transcript_10704/m.29277 type:complete len:122 (+) Transcript_10704:756-1121(+)
MAVHPSSCPVLRWRGNESVPGPARLNELSSHHNEMPSQSAETLQPALRLSAFEQSIRRRSPCGPVLTLSWRKRALDRGLIDVQRRLQGHRRGLEMLKVVEMKVVDQHVSEPPTLQLLEVSL